MKRDKDKELDGLFKNGLGDPPHQAAYQEGDWDAMEQMLDGPKKRRVIPLWLPLTSAAAVLLIAFGWWFFAPVASKQQQGQQVVKMEKPSTKDSSAQLKPKLAEESQVAAVPEKANLGQADKRITPEKANSGNADASQKASNGPLAAAKKKPSEGDVTKPGATRQDNQIAATKNNLGNADNSKGNPAQGNNSGAVATNAAIIANSPVKVVGTVDSSALASNKPIVNTALGIDPAKKTVDSILTVGNTDVIASTKPKVSKPSGDNHVTLGLSLLGAPEINGAGSLSNGMRGTSVGLLISASYKRLTLTTGASYAKKPYGSKYEQSTTQYAVRGYLDGVADCRVLDIPINLDFQLYNKRQNKFSVGTGISSYLMLRESYLYNYVDPNIAPSTYTVPGMHKYMFSILNLQATYTRQVSSKIGLSFQPYFKLPLAQIGNSKAKLQTAGFAVGVNWSLNPGKKH